MFFIYGDESSFGSTIVYGAIAFPDFYLSQIESAIANLKIGSGVKSSSEFHARILFNGDRRRKSEWKLFNELQVFDFSNKFCKLLKDYHCFFSLGALCKDDYPKEFPNTDNFQGGIMDNKQLNAFVFQSAMIPLIQSIGFKNIKFWVDPDETIISFFGKNMRADRNYKAIVPDDNNVPPIAPEVIQDQHPVLLEAADLFAYVSAHALAPESCRQKYQFEAMYSIFNPLLTTFENDPDGSNRSILLSHHNGICEANSQSAQFYKLPIGACTWVHGFSNDGKTYPCIFLKVPLEQSKKVVELKQVNVRAGVHIINSIPVVFILFRFKNEPTIYTLFVNHNLSPETSLLTQLSHGHELRLVMFEDEPTPKGEISFTEINPAFWSKIKNNVEEFPRCSEETFWTAVHSMKMSPQELWESL